jgi:hypothetical protein
MHRDDGRRPAAAGRRRHRNSGFDNDVHVLRRQLGLSLPVAAISLALATGCGEYEPKAPPGLRINEVVSQNEGVWLDEQGETDDYIELYNTSSDAVSLSDYTLVDDGGERTLPDLTVGPHGRLLLWADGTPEQGVLHLEMKVSSLGETLRLVRSDGAVTDKVNVPALAEHQAYARMPDGIGHFKACGWATPGRKNGETCGPEDVDVPVDDIVFAPYSWQGAWPPASLPLTMSEARLDPDAFVEITNSSNTTVSLDGYELWVAPHAVGNPWPVASEGVVLALPSTELASGERTSIELSADILAPILENPRTEGVFTLADGAGAVVDRMDFSSFPAGAALARFPEPDGSFVLCGTATPGAPNDECDELEAREVSDHERRLLTAADFHQLARGRGGVGIESVEFVIDMVSGDVVAFLNSEDWDLHYTFVREVIQKKPHLDRCDPAQRLEYNQGWFEFSNTEYFQVEGRRYLMGTLVRHAGSEYSTVEFAAGDTISPEQMQKAFFTVLKNVNDPKIWMIRPTEPDQINRLRLIEGSVPAVGPNAPFRDVTFQPLTPGEAYGTLKFVRADELRTTPLGPRDIVVTDQVPNDIPLIGGLVTEAFQTPLAHVNILSRGRGTPNMALRNARTDPRLEPYFDELVHLVVDGTDFSVESADPEKALAFWDDRKPEGTQSPRLDAETRGVVALEERGLGDIPTIGGKAAQVAELLRVPFCVGPISVPKRPFAIPMVHSVEHFEKSGARALLDNLVKDPKFLADPLVRERGLERVRNLITTHPMDSSLLRSVQHAIGERWVNQALRFRSSSNTEDLPGFSGAGLYSSEGVDVEDLDTGVEDAIRTVWASLWLRRGFDERDYYGVDQHAVAMAVLVHPAYRSERVNGVAVSRDALEPTRGDRYYINAQLGEALVTNPAPGIDSDEITFDPFRPPYAMYHSRSTFTPDEPVMTQTELAFLACNLAALNQYFRPRLDPAQENPWFAVDIEFKLMGPERELVIKQSRSYSFGQETPTSWCDF